ncbi:hypothetical protein SS1G_04588 [Sclerotinia sclerotiorum 1980 UF-70]|uniref:Protein YOP1 n=1 Tax=Sclerotinia sclerotiorum (strain ATCC 18683 / 1980 / Ss-1) TaxID=665079 RepID=A7EGZ6_SCLS1|nr:hypothetical protein SS1G_04588 [Sclerotinia sclerotiorum 1980 UF-70]EDO02112.1 hypothetical protein SS1G_04588 [Sclerotinia sclerotiorum 1980 UF-70]
MFDTFARLLSIPFYSWFRLGFLLYLILPQTQGARVLYQTHVHPWLHNNELAIDDLIASAHERAKAAGVTYLNQAIELIRQHIFGLPPKEPTPPSTPSAYSYTHNLMARFNLPSARPSFPSNPIGGATSTATDFYSLLASAVTAATSSNAATGGSEGRDLSNSGMLIPPHVSGNERITFIQAQRERLSILLSALDKEAQTLQNEKRVPRNISSMSFDGTSSEDDNLDRPKSSMSGMTSRKSEPDFEKIDADSGTEEVGNRRREAERTSSANWMPWAWGAKSTSPTGNFSDDKGKSSGVDA